MPLIHRPALVLVLVEVRVHAAALETLDEPASGLDPIGQRDVRNLMMSLRDEGVTILLSSHQLSEIETVCDRVSILHHGLVAAEGRLNELLNVAGMMSFTVTGLSGGVPDRVAELATETAFSGSKHVFSAPESAVRVIVEAVDDAGGTIEAIVPKRQSLEDYFARLLSDTAQGSRAEGEAA